MLFWKHRIGCLLWARKTIPHYSTESHTKMNNFEVNNRVEDAIRIKCIGPQGNEIPAFEKPAAFQADTKGILVQPLPGCLKHIGKYRLEVSTLLAQFSLAVDRQMRACLKSLGPL